MDRMLMMQDAPLEKTPWAGGQPNQVASKMILDCCGIYMGQ